MKVANVIEEGKLGGPQVRMVRIARALRKQVGTIIIMPIDNSAEFCEMCEANNVEYKALPITKLTRTWTAARRYIFYSIWEVFQLAKVFKKQRVDLVHASGGSWQYKAIIAARLAKIPSIWHLNDTSAPWFTRYLFMLLQFHTNGFIFASHRSKNYYKGLIKLGRPSAIIPSTVDIESFNPSQVMLDVELFDLAGPTIGTVVNVSPVKGLETLIYAAAELALEGWTPNVVIVGAVAESQHTYFQSLKTLGSQLGVEKLYFYGARKDVRPILKKIDVYVCSSKFESSPVSVWEAMAMALPVVSTDVGDVSLHLKEEYSGFIVPVGNYKLMAKQLARLLDDEALQLKLGEAARAAAKTFDPSKIAYDTLSIYERVLEQEK